MVDADLERRYADCVELVEAWKHYLDLVNKALKSGEAVPTQVEEQFLNAKARIAMLHDSFMDSLKHDKQTGQAMIDLVNRSISLRSLQQANEADKKKVEIEWHECFLLLNETVSQLNEDREELANRNQLTYNLGKLRERAATNLSAFLRSFYFKAGVVLLAIAFTIWGVPAMGIYDWDNLRDVGFTQPLISGYYSITRDWLGLNMPYIDMEAFEEQVATIEDPNHILENQTNGELDQDTFFSSRLPYITGGQNQEQLQEMREKLEEAQGYAGYELQRKSSNRPRGSLYAFWFRESIDATQFQAMWGDIENINEEQWEMVRKVNVVLILQTSGQDEMNLMRDAFVAKIPPLD